MIDFRICQRCPHGEWHAPTESLDGEFEVKPSVGCALSGDVLLMNSNPPPDCPDSLQHKLVTQDVPLRFADHMSGGRY